MTIRRSLTFISLVLLAACSGGDCAERPVRAVIEQMEQAAENRDVRELGRHLSEDYRDTHLI